MMNKDEAMIRELRTQNVLTWIQLAKPEGLLTEDEYKEILISLKKCLEEPVTINLSNKK